MNNKVEKYCLYGLMFGMVFIFWIMTVPRLLTGDNISVSVGQGKLIYVKGAEGILGDSLFIAAAASFLLTLFGLLPLWIMSVRWLWISANSRKMVENALIVVSLVFFPILATIVIYYIRHVRNKLE